MDANALADVPNIEFDMNRTKALSIDVDGIRTRYFEAGNGKTVLLVHGGQFGDYYSSYNWSLNFDSLAGYFHVIAFDKLGMGFTDNPKADADFTMEATIHHAARFLEVLRVTNVTIVGHSRGALVATRLALDMSDLIDQLIVVDSNTLAPDDPSVPRDFYQKIERSLPSTPTKESVCLEPIENSYSRFHITEDFVNQMYEIASLPKTLAAKQKMKSGCDNLFRSKLKITREETLDSIRTGNLKQPTLIMWGLNDPSAPYILALDLFRLISSQNGKTELHIFNHAGHYSFRERCLEFNSALKAFVELEHSFQSTMIGDGLSSIDYSATRSQKDAIK